MQRSVWTKSVGRGTRGRGQRVYDSQIQLEKHPGNNNQQCEAICKGNSSQAFQNLRYEEACAAIQQNAEKFIGDQESSESEDDLDDCGIIKNTFEFYGGDNTTDLRKTQEFLQNSLTSGAVVCLICIESVKRNDSVWSCQNCYCMLHVTCIQKWAKDSIFYQSSNLDDNSKKQSLKWCCPKCRQEYKPSDKPTKYFCFCGKIEDPPFNPWRVPHSCGQTCEKKLKPHCGHDCLLLCHPGPCPPCPKTVETSCYCGKSKPMTRRCSDSVWSCKHPCKRVLSCGQHFCEQPCHGGDCPPCSKQSLQNCLCGNEKKLQPCNKPTWQCEKVCVKPLECGNHLCLTKCHGGECSSCPKAGPRPCPCKKKLVWLPCTEEVPPCGDTCDKLLECELHKCSQRCHYGSCGSCLQVRVMKCRCGQREKSVPCCKEYICDIKCKGRRDCGKHNCNRKCCTGNCPPCEAPCGRPLNCGSHKCKSRCHPGPCYPCRETVEITCNCESTKIAVPCGMKKSAVPPRCSAPCKVPPNCHHLERHKHRCHFGTCPPCRNICGKNIECGHTCPVRCHSAVLTKVEINKKKAGPWDLVNSYRMELVCEPCPSCVVPVPYTCLGGHETQNFPCSEARPWSCGRKCGRHLLCSNHTCQLECHTAGTEKTSFKQSDRCEPCQEPCSKARPKGCNHPCLQPCHPDSCPPCMQRLKMRCHCQLNPVYLVCDEWVQADTTNKDVMLSCKNRCPKELSCGHRCPLICHQGECAGPQMCKKKVIIRCPCKRLKQEMLCYFQNQNASFPSCDDICFQQQQMEKAEKLAQENKQREEEARKRQQEFDEFQRKMEGKKKKHKKVREAVERTPWWKPYFYWTISGGICALGILIYIYTF